MTYPWVGGNAWNGSDPWPGPDSVGGPLTLTVTPEPDATPPRVRIDVDDATGALASVTVRRLDADGRYRKVRTSDDGPLLIEAGSATVYDYEAPFGQAVTYTTDVAGGPSVTVTLDVADVWLIHLQVPARSVRVPKVSDLGNRSYALDAAVFEILEREYPIPATSGARQAPSGTLTVGTFTLDELQALKDVLADGSVLLVNVPASLGYGFPTSYCQFFSVDENRIIDYGPWQHRDWPLPYQTVDRPAGGTQAGVSWNDVATVGDDDYTAADGSAFATWDEVAAANDAWSQVAAP
jgi:hypothetical protein